MAVDQLDPHLLVALDALIRERHVSHAAERVGVTPSAMSKSLQRLRTIFRDPLLARVGHEYLLTPRAEQLAEPVQEILRLIERLERGMEFDPARDQRRFRIAAHDGTAFLLLRPLLRQVLREAPHISFSVEPLTGPRTVELLESGELDLAIWTIDSVESHLSQERLYSDRFVGAVWAQREDVGERLTMEQFLTMPRANYFWPGHHRMGERFPEWLTMEEPPVRFTDRLYILRLLLLRETEMLAINWEKVISSLASIADVRAVELPFDTPSIGRGMVWHPRNTPDPAHRWLREQLADVAAEL